MESRPTHYMGGPNSALLALRNCALVCREWYHLTWCHLRQRISFRNRNDVLTMRELLRARPCLGSIPKQVVIRGFQVATSPADSDRAQILHLETFATMLSRKLSNVSVFYIRDAIWTTSPFQSRSVRHLAAFCSVETLVLSRVTVTRLSQLALLISSLPQLQVLTLRAVDCLHAQVPSWVFMPLHCEAKLQKLYLLRVAVTVEEFFIRLSETCNFRYIAHATNVKRARLVQQMGGCQRLLDANASSLEVLRLSIGNAHPTTSCSEVEIGMSVPSSQSDC